MPDGERRSGPGPVVVGVDGSEGSRRALEFAMDEAAWRAVPVHAVVANDAPSLWEGVATPAAPDLHEVARKEAASLVESVVDARRCAGEPVPAIEIEVHSGPPAPVLERLSRGATLLVVGHRGRGAVRSMLIGSVSLSCVVHAGCTVVVVRG
ncbi:hypothetical protein AD006_31030 (plasmid) [Pseudonocardia sp. EC080610-09]|nr:hypothetical protein AD006_31030 [Pseudonocardia sp. EC080610-09]ALL85753.1 hypothetical protein AD017_30200 [Pseudonocardia sp. EC080619-01]